MNEETFLPLFDNILLNPETEDYLLKQTDPTYTENGIVVAVGPDVKTVKVGDKIATFVFGMKHATRDGKTYHTIRELPAFIQGRYE